MTAARKIHHSYEDYLSALRDSEVKLEYSNGIIYAMAGGTVAHGELSGAAIRLFGQALLGRCRVSTSDVKVRIDKLDQSFFPDGSVICGEVRRSPVDHHCITNPKVLIEVTSKSTEEDDRGDKLASYQSIPSLNAVVIISHRELRVTLVTRTTDGWHTEDYVAGKRVRLEDPAVEFTVDELYAGITLEP